MKAFTWHTPEYHHTEKTKDWYWTVGIITGALAITSMIFGNILFALVLIIGVSSLALFASRRPNFVSVEISDKGVIVDKTLYPYRTLESFGIDEVHHGGPRLFLKSKKVVMPLIAVPINTHDLDLLRDFLGNHLNEESFGQDIFHHLFERMGF